MSKKADVAASTRIYRVARLVPIWGDVVRESNEIDETAAVAVRKAEGDIVVCGATLAENQMIARRIETAAHGACKQESPHKNAGGNALPHFQPITRPPHGHTFYETVTRKSKKDKNP